MTTQTPDLDPTAPLLTREQATSALHYLRTKHGWGFFEDHAHTITQISRAIDITLPGVDLTTVTAEQAALAYQWLVNNDDYMCANEDDPEDTTYDDFAAAIRETVTGRHSAPPVDPDNIIPVDGMILVNVIDDATYLFLDGMWRRLAPADEDDNPFGDEDSRGKQKVWFQR